MFPRRLDDRDMVADLVVVVLLMLLLVDVVL
jgi:hypothetical protein